MNRRHFLLSSIGMLAAGRAEAKLDGYEILLGKLDLNIGAKEVLVQTGGSRSALRLGTCAFLFAPNTKVSFEVKNGFVVKVANLISGAMHSVFEPNLAQERQVITSHATIGIRGTAHYVEIEKDKDRTYSCCCYGHVHIDGGATNETQRTTYHDARIIGRDGKIEASPYSVPLNHFDNSLVFLESKVNRSPRWKLPNGQMQFISPFELPE